MVTSGTLSLFNSTLSSIKNLEDNNIQNGHISCICEDGHTGGSVGLINLLFKEFTMFFFSYLRKLFWTDLGAQPVVERTSLEGKNRVIIASTNLVSPSGLTIDFTEDRLFWCDQRKGVVETAALDGSDRQVLLENQVGEACVTHTCTSSLHSEKAGFLERFACH